MFERFTGEARAVVLGAQAEAEALGDEVIGSEHLLLSLLRDPAGAAARLLALWGVEARGVRDDVERLAGDGGPDIDAGALATLGIDLDEIRSRVESTFGPGALGRRRAAGARLPFGREAKKSLELALREALSLGDRHIGAEHVLLGLLRDERGEAARILRSRGVDRAAVRDAMSPRPAG
jgi:ATP-dependent Clp protease ATP-binding subunit ClpA